MPRDHHFAYGAGLREHLDATADLKSDALHEGAREITPSV